MKTVGIDVGGTFTDLVLHDRDARRIWSHKTLSTPNDPAVGALDGLSRLLANSGTRAEELEEITYATTVATNAVLQRKAQSTALITTEGFRDVLLIGRQMRHDLFDLYIQKRAPLLRRREIFTVSERMRANGSVHKSLDEDEVRTLAATLRAKGVQSVAVSLLHAYANPAHELRIEEILRENDGCFHISLSHRVSAFMREYERSNTTVVDAYVKPAVERHLAGLESALGAMGIKCPFNVMLSDASIREHRRASAVPVRLIESGPAAAAQAGAFIGGLAGESNVIAFDMGGTTAKIAIMEDGVPSLTDEFEVDRQGLAARSGLPVTIPSVDLIEIGSGGGSIAWVDSGTLHVGPESAGADPGPACYSRGGDRPTVTDANVLLGYLAPTSFLGGEMELSAASAREAIEAHVAAPLDLSAEQAAVGIFEVVNAAMEQAVRAATVQRGKDPRTFSLVALGGAGPVHALALARMLGISQVIVPALSGVASALGMLNAERRVSLARSAVTLVDEEFSRRATYEFEHLAADAIEELIRGGRSRKEIQLRRRVDLRYVGQGFELTIDVPDGPIKPKAILEAFYEKYDAMYSLRDRATPVQATTWRLDAVATERPISLQSPAVGTAGTSAVRAGRRMYDAVLGEWVDGMAIEYGSVATGDVIVGPAVIQMRESALILFSGDTCSVGATGNLVVTIATVQDAVPPADLAAAGEIDVDPVTLSVIWEGFNAMCQEMGYHFQRVAFSELAREASDVSAAFFDAQGQLVAQGVFSPGHLGAMVNVMKYVVEHFPAAELDPNDAVVTNDIYIAAGQLSDMFMIAPVYVDEVLVGYAGTSTHLIDVGGAAPGSQMVTGVYDNYAEGVRVPPMKLFRGGAMNEEVMELITYNTRFPDKTRGDIRALYAALSVARRHVEQVVGRFGRGVMEACFGQIMDRSEEQVRGVLAQVPDGTYSAELFIDDYGPDTEPIKVACDVTVSGTDISVDWGRSSEQVAAGINSSLSYTYAYSYFAIKAMLFPEVPQNAGCLRPFSLTAPLGSFFNPRPPAPGAGRAMTIHRHFEAIAMSLGQALPERAIGASSQWCTVLIGGDDPDDPSRSYLYADLLIGGFAASSTADGAEGMCSVFNSSNLPIEVAETAAPIVVQAYGFVQDSCGAGRNRGACAVHRDVYVDGVRNRTTPIGDRNVFAPHGVLGGKEGGLGLVVLDPGGPNESRMHSKGVASVPRGVTVRYQTSGAGGYGPPFERDPEAVRDDVLDGFVSRDIAERDYGVRFLEGDELLVDLAATAMARAAAADSTSAASGAMTFSEA